MSNFSHDDRSRRISGGSTGLLGGVTLEAGGVHLGVELRRKGIWGTDIGKRSPLPVSLAEVTCCRQPGP